MVGQTPLAYSFRGTAEQGELVGLQKAAGLSTCRWRSGEAWGVAIPPVATILHCIKTGIHLLHVHKFLVFQTSCERFMLAVPQHTLCIQAKSMLRASARSC